MAALTRALRASGHQAIDLRHATPRPSAAVAIVTRETDRSRRTAPSESVGAAQVLGKHPCTDEPDDSRHRAP